MNKIKGQYINNAKGVKTFIGSLDSLPEDLLEDATVLIVETVPVGTVIHSFRTEEPFGYLFCDGQAFDPVKYPELHEVFPDDHVPDLRECVLVGAGENDTASIAAHDVYTVGQFKDDQAQGHYHNDGGHSHETGWGSSPDNGAGFLTPQFSNDDDNPLHTELASANVTEPKTDGTNGTPRTGTTTHGKQVGINYFVKAI